MPKTIAVIGLGSIGQRHTRNLAALGHQVVGFDPATPGNLAWPIDWDVAIRADGIIISAPTAEHYGLLVRAVSSRVPTLIEKPIFDGKEPWKGNLDLVMVGNNLRFHIAVKQAKRWLDDNRIGSVLWAHFCVGQYTDKEVYHRDGVLLNWGAHEFDLVTYLLGSAKVLAAAGDDVIADVFLQCDDGEVGGISTTIHLDYVTRPERRIFVIVGTMGTISVNLVGRVALLVLPSGQVHEGYGPEGSFDQDYVDEMEAFISMIDGKPVPHAATGEDGLRTLELILEAKRMAGIP